MTAPEVPIEIHLDAASPKVLALFERFRALVDRCGPTTLRVTKTAITFKGVRRGFGGARPHPSWLSGYLDLQREAAHPTIRWVAPYTKRLYVHHFRVTDSGQMDEAFAGLVAEAYAVGAGEHVLSGSPPGRSGHAERGMGGGTRATS
jgi:Domain of unknown function (DUF5655)